MFETAWAVAITVALQTAGATAPSTSGQQPAASIGVWTDDRPFSRLFLNLANDLRSLPSAGSAVVLSAGGAGAVAVRGADTRLANWSARAGNSSYTVAGRVLGDGWVQLGGAVATYGIGKLFRQPQAVHLGSDLIRAQALNGLVTTAIKFGVDRARPSGGQHAFPSGHTSATFASAATLHAHYGWKAGIPAFVTAGFVAWTRARDRAHWLSDVAFGSAIGIVTGRAVAAKHQPRRVTIVPAPMKGGGAIYLTVQLNERAARASHANGAGRRGSPRVSVSGVRGAKPPV